MLLFRKFNGNIFSKSFSLNIFLSKIFNAKILSNIDIKFNCFNFLYCKRLLTVQAEAYTKPTISKLLPLHNNYVPTVGNLEDVTTQETQEETAFLDAIMPTSVMRKAEKFLVDKGYITTRTRLSNGNYRNNDRAFREAIHQIWFGLYSRENGTLGSSGFEHVFLGEIKQGKVQGFHNWVFFSKEEQNNNLNYKGKIGPYVNLGAVGD